MIIATNIDRTSHTLPYRYVMYINRVIRHICIDHQLFFLSCSNSLPILKLYEVKVSRRVPLSSLTRMEWLILHICFCSLPYLHLNSWLSAILIIIDLLRFNSDCSRQPLNMRTTWKDIAPVPNSQEFLDIVLSRTQRRLPTQIRAGFKITRIRGIVDFLEGFLLSGHFRLTKTY